MIANKRRELIRTASILIALILCTTVVSGASVTPAKSSTKKQPKSIIASKYSPQKIRLTNVRDTQFTVSWITKGNCAGKINYGETPSLGKVSDDDRGGGILGRLHHVTVKHLKPNTLYYFQVVSGNKTFNNGMEPYICQTGPTIIPPKCDVAYGRIFLKFNKRPQIPYEREAITYLTIANKDTAGSGGESAPESVLLDENGYWSCELANIREKSLVQLFDYCGTGDTLKIEAETGMFSTVVTEVDTASDSPAKNIEIVERKIKNRK